MKVAPPQGNPVRVPGRPFSLSDACLPRSLREAQYEHPARIMDDAEGAKAIAYSELAGGMNPVRHLVRDVGVSVENEVLLARTGGVDLSAARAEVVRCAADVLVGVQNPARRVTPLSQADITVSGIRGPL